MVRSTTPSGERMEMEEHTAAMMAIPGLLRAFMAEEGEEVRGRL
jgi:hypothetical protein